MSWTKSKNLLLFTISIALSLLIAEVGIRFVRPMITYSELTKLIGSYYAPDQNNTFTIKKNYQGYESTMDGRGLAIVTTNSEGFRSTREANAISSNILIIGDSYTFGVYVNDDETYPSIIEQTLNVPEKFRVINAGYTSGHETDQQYSWFQRNFSKIKPKIVVWGVFLGNDIFGISPQYWSEKNSEGLPVKYINPNIYVDSFGRIRAKEFNPLNTVNTQTYYKIPVLRELHLWIAANRVLDRVKRVFETDDGKEISKGGYIASNWNHIYGEYSDEFLQKEDIFLKLLNSANQICEENGCKFVVALHPINFMVQANLMNKVIPNNEFFGLEPTYYQRLGAKLKDMDIKYIDIHKNMIASPGTYFPKNGEVHYDSNGNKFAGELIANYLLKEFPSILKSEN